jgi:hypothetical protein
MGQDEEQSRGFCLDNYFPRNHSLVSVLVVRADRICERPTKKSSDYVTIVKTQGEKNIKKALSNGGFIFLTCRRSHYS